MPIVREAECPRSTEGGPAAESSASTGAQTREQLLAALKTCGWNKAEVARRLGLNRATVWRKMKQWGIPLDGPKGEV